jgi:hypothetical protein
MELANRTRRLGHRHRFIPRLEQLEDRTLPSSSAVTTFAGNAQHTADYQPAAQSLNSIHWQTPVDLQPQYSGSDLLIHYGSPLITANNTVLVPVKTGATGGFEINAFNGATGAPMYTLTTDYILPSHDWVPSYSPCLATTSTGTLLYYAGAGGTVYYITNPDSSSPGTPTQVCFYTAMANYQANASAYNSSIFINTPIISDSSGNIYFGFRVQGTAPAPLNTTESGFARIAPDGTATYVLTGTAANNSAMAWDAMNSAPALSNDGSTLYVVVKSADSWSTNGYLLGLNSTTLATEYQVALTDPVSGLGAGILDDGTASPLVGPDGNVFIGVMGNPYNGSRGYLLQFNSTLTQELTPGAFGWDSTAAIVPSSMVPSYTGTSSYLIFTKYNNYSSTEVGSTGGSGVNQVAILDPNATEADPHNDGSSSLQVMQQVMTVNGPTPDPANTSAATPNATREWCINTAAVDPATGMIYFPSEDGNLYGWSLQTDQLTQSINLAPGIGQAYVPTVIGPDGTVYAISNATLFAVGNAPGESMTISSSAGDSRGTVTGQALTFTAQVTNTGSSGSVPTGTITFEDTTGSTTTVLGTATLDNTGKATLTTSNLPAGNRFITAVYSGDGSFGSDQATLVQVVHGSGTTTVLTVTPNPSSYGQAVTLAATVTPTVSGLGTPTGMVTFTEGTTVLGEVPLSSSGQASFTTSALSPGSHTITATYQSDPIFAMSSGDNSASPLVVQEATTTTVGTSLTSSVFGQNVTITATVAAQDAGAGTPLGTVTFTEGSTVLASGVAVDATGKASFTTSGLSIGSHTITATFTGAPGWLSSTGNNSSAPVVVSQDGTTTVLTASPTSAVTGQTVTLTATVTANSPGSGTPGDTVTFKDGSTVLGTATLNSSGQATLTTSALAVGSHTLTASYGGDTNFTSSSGSAPATVSAASTTTTLTSSANPSVKNHAVTFTALVSAVAPGTGTPTGTVTFMDGTTVLATVTLNSSGKATFTTSSLKVGTHPIKVIYNGSTKYLTSTSVILSQVVKNH